MKADWQEHINGIHYNGSWLSRDSILTMDNSNLPEWESEHLDFMKSWINDKALIEVKTSGSTGKPKIIRLNKNTMVASAQYTCSFLSVIERDTALLCLPSTFIGGKMMIVRAFVNKLRLDTVKPTASVKCKKKYDLVAMTPHQLSVSLTNHPGLLASIKNLLIGGSETPDMLIDKLQSSKCNCYSTYGMTETSSHIALRKLNGPDRQTFFQTIDPSIKLTVDKNDCLGINAPYLGPTTLETRDVVKILDERSFRISGRFDNVINSGGIKLHPEEIEAKLRPFFAFDFIVFRIDDNRYGERPAILIEKRVKDEKHRIREVLSSQLNSTERPETVFIIDKMVKTANGKIHRNASIKQAIKL